jgi:alkylhydroperoxidase family enzyme
MYCRTMGIDGDMLSALVQDLGNVTPERIRAIIAFALKAASSPQEMEAADFDRLRDQGVTDEEIMEIILVAAMSRYTNTLSDVLQIDVDPAVTETLERLR